MKNYIKFPLPTTASWFRLPERVKALEDSSFNAAEYDLADFTNTGIDPFVKTSDLPPYKVYTALLTQSGGDNEQIISSGPVKQGVTYWVIDNDTPGSNWDFSNVGGPVYPYGGYFVAINSEIPISYFGPTVKYNTGAPVATVLENTIGDIWFTYNGVGVYYAMSNALFPGDKTTCITSQSAYEDTGATFIYRDGENEIAIETLDFFSELAANDILARTMLEIRVYN